MDNVRVRGYGKVIERVNIESKSEYKTKSIIIQVRNRQRNDMQNPAENRGKYRSSLQSTPRHSVKFKKVPADQKHSYAAAF